MASKGVQWLSMKRAWHDDDDPALPPEQLRARLKQRAKLARRAERATALALHLPLPAPPTDKGGRPSLAAVQSSTLQRREREEAHRFKLSLIESALPDFDVVGLEAAATAEAVAAKAVAEEVAAERAAAERAAAEQAAVEVLCNGKRPRASGLGRVAAKPTAGFLVAMRETSYIRVH